MRQLILYLKLFCRVWTSVQEYSYTVARAFGPLVGAEAAPAAICCQQCSQQFSLADSLQALAAATGEKVDIDNSIEKK